MSAGEDIGNGEDGGAPDPGVGYGAQIDAYRKAK